ncbi:hypothetical protein EI42_02993 [Thermosporothrix hazakensis]|uniref:Uncharacterized protein n=1 Tax=Thermosporothrix hazakensis TaxID=644383 RepID=A0A326U5Q5_THEHA|nr:hypothetical protein EI42_02993 [Thermosporothrix hazakensis]
MSPSFSLECIIPRSLFLTRQVAYCLLRFCYISKYVFFVTQENILKIYTFLLVSTPFSTISLFLLDSEESLC